MDIDEGEYFPFLLSFRISDLFITIDLPAVGKERPATVRLLPYVDVPGMDVHSRLFHKAQATIAKQASLATTASSSSKSPEGKATTERLFNLQHGMLFLL